MNLALSHHEAVKLGWRLQEDVRAYRRALGSIAKRLNRYAPQLSQEFKTTESRNILNDLIAHLSYMDQSAWAQRTQPFCCQRSLLLDGITPFHGPLCAIIAASAIKLGDRVICIWHVSGTSVSIECSGAPMPYGGGTSAPWPGGIVVVERSTINLDVTPFIVKAGVPNDYVEIGLRERDIVEQPSCNKPLWRWTARFLEDTTGCADHTGWPCKAFRTDKYRALDQPLSDKSSDYFERKGFGVRKLFRPREESLVHNEALEREYGPRFQNAYRLWSKALSACIVWPLQKTDTRFPALCQERLSESEDCCGLASDEARRILLRIRMALSTFPISTLWTDRSGSDTV
ncbi:MAG: hypothetical protein GF344_09975, partial [Chitinivibrionales bacterium]|nr:hypothetical protein [Chitinivibrionales bacterium]